MLPTFLNACKNFVNMIKHAKKKFTKPTTATLVVGTLSDLPRSRADLLAENAMLRQQLIVLNHSVKRPKLTAGDRVRLTFLARLTNS